MCIIHPNINEETKTALVERFDTILKDDGAEVIESKGWEKHRLAYETNGLREGICHIINITSPSTAGAINKFDRLTKVSDDIIHHMIVKIEA